MSTEDENHRGEMSLLTYKGLILSVIYISFGVDLVHLGKAL